MTIAPDLSRDAARALDAADPLAPLRERFCFPQRHGADAVYFCGNSLGLQPKATRDYLEVELEDWAALGVEGHFQGRNPWYDYHAFCADAAAHVVGASTREVVMMNALTVNLHLLLASFYRPSGSRTRLVTEAGAFPSDRYAVRSQARMHGLDPDEHVVELKPRDGEALLRDEDIVDYLKREGERVACVMLGGVNYYTGQFFDLERIVKAGHAAGAHVGFDLAHAAGNVPLRLHDWGADFAVWCSYKYLNSGPGGVAGAFVHERHAERPDLVRYAGWWGNDPKTRFTMPDGFHPQAGAAGWQLSNAPVLPMAAFRASGDLFVEAGMPALRHKSERLTGYLQEHLDTIDAVDVLTPRDPARRGCQLSLQVRTQGEALQRALEAEGVICDYRPPGVVRAAPVPLYNTFEDVWRFADTLRRILT